MNAPRPPFAIEVLPVAEGSTRVEVHGELDLSTSPELANALDTQFDGGSSVVLDLSRVTFIDSTALNVLVMALRACEENGCKLALRPELPPQVSRVFQITGLDAVLPIAAD